MTTTRILFLRQWHHFIAYDVNSSTDESLSGFDAAFDRSFHDPPIGGALGGIPPGYDGGVEVARGGKWVLWSRSDGRAYTADNRGRGYFPSSLSGGDAWHGFCRWLNSRDKWIEFNDHGNPNFIAFIHNAQGTTEIARPSGLFSEWTHLCDVRCLEKRRTIRLAISAEARETFSTAVLLIGNHAVREQVHKYSVPIPGEYPSGIVKESSISPGCDRVAWLVALDQSHTESPRLALFVSTIDLKNIRMVASVDCSRPLYEPPFESIQWLPDQSAVSFVYKSQLWKIPINK